MRGGAVHDFRPVFGSGGAGPHAHAGPGVSVNCGRQLRLTINSGEFLTQVPPELPCEAVGQLKELVRSQIRTWVHFPLFRHIVNVNCAAAFSYPFFTDPSSEKSAQLNRQFHGQRPREGASRLARDGEAACRCTAAGVGSRAASGGESREGWGAARADGEEARGGRGERGAGECGLETDIWPEPRGKPGSSGCSSLQAVAGWQGRDKRMEGAPWSPEAAEEEEALSLGSSQEWKGQCGRSRGERTQSFASDLTAPGEKRQDSTRARGTPESDSPTASPSSSCSSSAFKQYGGESGDDAHSSGTEFALQSQSHPFANSNAFFVPSDPATFLSPQDAGPNPPSHAPAVFPEATPGDASRPWHEDRDAREAPARRSEHSPPLSRSSSTKFGSQSPGAYHTHMFAPAVFSSLSGGASSSWCCRAALASCAEDRENSLAFWKSSSPASKLQVLRCMLADTAAATIQRVVRGHLGRLRMEKLLAERREFLRLSRAATVIQAGWRRVKAQEAFLVLHFAAIFARERQEAAVKIQAFWKMRIQRDKYRTMHLVECLSALRRLAAIELQRVWRGRVTRKVLDDEWQKWIIKWPWDKPGTIVEVVGDFSNPPWTKRYLMTYCYVRRCFILPLPRKPGRYEVKFIVDGRYVCDGSQTVVADGNGHFNNLIRVRPSTKSPFRELRDRLQQLQEQSQEMYFRSASSPLCVAARPGGSFHGLEGLTLAPGTSLAEEGIAEAAESPRADDWKNGAERCSEHASSGDENIEKQAPHATVPPTQALDPTPYAEGSRDAWNAVISPGSLSEREAGRFGGSTQPHFGHDAGGRAEGQSSLKDESLMPESLNDPGSSWPAAERDGARRGSPDGGGSGESDRGTRAGQRAPVSDESERDSRERNLFAGTEHCISTSAAAASPPSEKQERTRQASDSAEETDRSPGRGEANERSAELRSASKATADRDLLNTAPRRDGDEDADGGDESGLSSGRGTGSGRACVDVADGGGRGSGCSSGVDCVQRDTALQVHHTEDSGGVSPAGVAQIESSSVESVERRVVGAASSSEDNEETTSQARGEGDQTQRALASLSRGCADDQGASRGSNRSDSRGGTHVSTGESSSSPSHDRGGTVATENDRDIKGQQQSVKRGGIQRGQKGQCPAAAVTAEEGNSRSTGDVGQAEVVCNKPGTAAQRETTAPSATQSSSERDAARAPALMLTSDISAEASSGGEGPGNGDAGGASRRGGRGRKRRSKKKPGNAGGRA
ncbi:IQ calmodulin-binding motif domain-containing protein [Besnoitia besnoiti]|uniref:IQ calmodulin-binding motif domain-containing protein n=1 Tax=Besnoitia besnoiti TaxID=94643 RepID=A0A2A9MMZ9_BESBE|nr:IQ calmodulin-binding motif domain-containing protein [Besnoitia besnoiti]PFH37851.1 IQ calmodulin-binding motif domain-containing protein [Besnoitia besnoiti]